MLGRKVKDEPDLIFTLFGTAVWTFCIVPCTQLLWRKKTQLQEVLMSIPRQQPYSSRKVKIILELTATTWTE